MMSVHQSSSKMFSFNNAKCQIAVMILQAITSAVAECETTGDAWGCAYADAYARAWAYAVARADASAWASAFASCDCYHSSESASSWANLGASFFRQIYVDACADATALVCVASGATRRSSALMNL
jgi:hypothetical protein